MAELAGFSYVSPERKAAIWTIMASVRETALPHLGCETQICPCGCKTSHQGSAPWLLGSGLCCWASQEEKATHSARLSIPFRMWKWLSPPESELGFGSASLVSWAPLTRLQKVAIVCTFVMESGCDCWALCQRRCCQCGKSPLEEICPSGILSWAGDVLGIRSRCQP